MASVVGLCRFSPNLPQKLLSMSLAVSLRPGFLAMRLGSRSMPSFCLYNHTYCALSVGVTAQAGQPTDSCLILSQVLT